MIWREVRNNQYQYYDPDSGIIVGEVKAGYSEWHATFNKFSSGDFISREHAQKDVEKAYERLLEDRAAQKKREAKKAEQP